MGVHLCFWSKVLIRMSFAPPADRINMFAAVTFGHPKEMQLSNSFSNNFSIRAALMLNTVYFYFIS